MLRLGLLASAILAALPALATGQTAQQDRQDSQEIVVTGTPLGETEKALADCIARKCPSAEDIKATLRHAENQFLHGDYSAALGTLRQARGRNRGHRREVPDQFADLMRATALVSRHLGEDQIYRVSTLSAQEVLADTHSASDPRVLIATLEIGDMYGHLGRSAEAEHSYRSVLSTARARGAAEIAAAARLRIVNLYILLAHKLAARDLYLRKAHAILAEMAADPDPRAQRFLLAGKLMTARIAAERGDESELETALADYRAQATSLNPVLISTQTVDLHENAFGNTSFNAPRFAAHPMEGQWFDVAFWVKPDGHVDDIEILRRSKQLTGPWVKAVLGSINGRRYAPLPLSPLDPGVLRIERYTYTSPLVKVTESAIRRHAPQGRIEMVDLSNDADATKP